MMLLQVFFLLWAAASHEVGGQGNMCSKQTKKGQKKCEKRDGCMWEGGMCVDKDGEMESDDDHSDDKKDGPVDYDETEWPWYDTQGPNYWQNCVRKFCEKHVWYGGMRMCHWEEEYGCGCEAMTEEDCLKSDECEFVGQGNTGCREKIRCNELTGPQCKLQSKCALCDKGCVDKCIMGPGQKNLPTLSMSLTQDCKCKVEAFF